jgi:hypothetical protein
VKKENNWIDRMYVLMGSRTQKEFAEWLEQSPKRVNNYFTGMIDYPSGNFLIALAKKGINLNWFLTGQGSPYIIEQKNLNTLESIPALLDMKHLTDKFIGNVAETIAEYKTKSKELQERKKTKK